MSLFRRIIESESDIKACKDLFKDGYAISGIRPRPQFAIQWMDHVMFQNDVRVEGGATVLNLRTTTSLKCEADPRRARI